MALALERIRRALGDGDHFVGGAPTAADLAVVSALQFVEPMNPTYLPLGLANTRCWRDYRLSAAFDDLVAWRDGFVARYRRPWSERKLG